MAVEANNELFWKLVAEDRGRIARDNADRVQVLEAALREIKDQLLSPDQSSAIAKAALAPERDK